MSDNQVYGIDYIGGANYIEQITSYHPEGFAAGFLCQASEWANGINAAEALAKTGKCSVMRIHGVWHDDHKFAKADIDVAISYLEQVIELASKNPNIQFYYSPWLEAETERRLMHNCLLRCRDILASNVELVNTSNNVFENFITEVHHSAPPTEGTYAFSFDGLSMHDADIAEWKSKQSKAIYFFAWVYRCNGLTGKNDKTPRGKRTAWLREKDFDWIQRSIILSPGSALA